MFSHGNIRGKKTKISRLLASIQPWANGYTAVGTITIGILLLIVFTRIVFPRLGSHMGGQELLDTMFWRPPEIVDSRLEAYGESGRQMYRRVLLFDLLFPIIYGPTLAASAGYAAGKLRALRQYVLVILFIPLAGGAFDWAENTILWVQTGQFPDQSILPSWIACAMTLFKFVALGVAVVIIVLGLSVAGWSRCRHCA